MIIDNYSIGILIGLHSLFNLTGVINMRVTIVGYEGMNSNNSNVYNIAKCLQRKDYLYRMLCPHFSQKCEIQAEKIIQEGNISRGLHAALLFSWHYFSRKIPERYLNETLFDNFAQRKMPTDSDVLLCTDGGLVHTIRKAKKNGVPTIVLLRTPHPTYLYNILSQESSRFGTWDDSIFTNKNWVLNRNITLDECDEIFVKSEIVKESCIREGVRPEKITVINSGVGVDTTYYRRGAHKGKEFTCLFIGHKSILNGVPYLLEAWKMVNPNTGKLIICGAQNQKLIQKYKEIINFDAPGIVSNPLAYYQSATIFVLPSLVNSFPRVVLEAMSCELPVIISEGVGSKVLIDDGKEGFIVPVRDAKAIAEKIQYFIDNPDEVTRMGKNARKKVESYSWPSFCDEVITKIEEIMN